MFTIGNIPYFYTKIYSICLTPKDVSMDSAGVKLVLLSPIMY